jgi:hypothetical protein
MLRARESDRELNMKRRYRVRRAGLVSAAVLMGVATAALAGIRYSDPGVTVKKNPDGSGRAYGTLGGTRNSTSPFERLACTVTRSESAGNPPVRSTFVLCSARDKNNVSASCTSTSDAVGDSLDGLASDGLIDFSWNAGGTCTTVSVYESSSLERKR